MLDRIQSAVVALSLAFLVWIYLRARDMEILDNAVVPVHVHLLPSDADLFDLDFRAPQQIVASFRGSARGLHQLREMMEQGQLVADVLFAIPQNHRNDMRYGETLRVNAQDIHGPPGVLPTILEAHNRIPIVVRKLGQRRLPVRLDPEPDEQVANVRIEPSVVLARGPKAILDRARAIATQPLAVSPPEDGSADSAATVSMTVPLVHDLDGRPVSCNVDAVKVTLTYRPRQIVYELTEVPIRFLCPEGFPFSIRFKDARDHRLRLRVTGPGGLCSPRAVAFVDLSAYSERAGVYDDLPVHIELPAQFSLNEPSPRCPPLQLAPWGRTEGHP